MLAEQAGFDVFVTGDKNLSYQQALTGRKLAVVVLGITRWGILQQHTETVKEAGDKAYPGSLAALTL